MRRRGAARRADQRGVPGGLADPRLGRATTSWCWSRRARSREDGEPIDPDEDDDEDEDGPDLLRVRMTAAAARSFVARAARVVAAGGRRARCAARRSTRRATSARAATATTSTSGDRSVIDRGVDARGAARGRGRDRRADRGLVEQRDARDGHARLPRPRADAGRRRDLQADPRRATARRLPGRDAGAARGRGVARVRGDPAGASSRRRSCATGRSARAWSRRSSRPIPTVDVVAMVVEDDERLRRMAVLDAVMNNTDRKGGHILPVDGGRHIYGVDHGVTFSPVPKLRTVLWGWRGTPLAPDEIEGVERIRDALAGELGVGAGGAAVAGGGARDGAAGGCAAGGRAVPVPVARLARHPVAAVLTCSRDAALEWLGRRIGRDDAPGSRPRPPGVADRAGDADARRDARRGRGDRPAVAPGRAIRPWTTTRGRASVTPADRASPTGWPCAPAAWARSRMPSPARPMRRRSGRSSRSASGPGPA